ncbi:OsmC family protein [Pelistega ratti]|uniref:OsmC family protein n=1 Tax=Pelistega ratti TaxID=2652177 RepID=UPI00135A6AD6|nr:OsmC family protein [Pelistega ratti]
MQCAIEWDNANGMLFIAQTDSGYRITMDSALDSHQHLAASPMELLLSGAGGCAASNVVVILKHSQQDISRCLVNITAEMNSTHPKVFTHIHFHFTVIGKALEAHIVNRAAKRAHDKYCSAIAMLEKTATISYSVSIEETHS